jgi:hypothetical protein
MSSRVVKVARRAIVARACDARQWGSRVCAGAPAAWGWGSEAGTCSSIAPRGGATTARHSSRLVTGQLARPLAVPADGLHSLRNDRRRCAAGLVAARQQAARLVS